MRVRIRLSRPKQSRWARVKQLIKEIRSVSTVE